MPDLLTQTIEILMQLFWGILSFFSGGTLISYANIWIALGIAIALALVTGLRNARDIRQFVFPSHIWKHASTRLDIAWYLIIAPIIIFAILPLLAFMQALSYEMVDGLTFLFGKARAVEAIENSWSALIAYTLILFMAKDFSFFLSHYLSHKWSVLWCFHKVHHSAPVMTPLTALRFHPLDLFWNMSFAVIFTAFASGLCQYTFYSGEDELMLFGNNLIIALSYLTTHNLRHSHVWLHYPNWLNRWLISPAMHQLHHSSEERHWDRNFGYLFAGWDRLWRCRYNPSEKEDYTLGVHTEDGLYDKHRSVWSLFWQPCREAWGVVRGK